MAIKYFKCPDNKKIKCEDCIKKCRMARRCVPATMPAYVYSHGMNRKTTGKLSVTQSLNPVVQNWMKKNTDSVVNLQRNIYSMTGTVNHIKHEEGGEYANGVECEIFLEDELNTGTCDQLEEIDGKYYLHDIKNKKCAQMYFLLDYKQIGDKKYALPSEKQTGSKLKDNDDVVLQLNRYRIMIEKERGIKIEGLFMDAVLIDYSTTASPERYGLEYQYYSIPVKILDDDYVMDIYKKATKDYHNLIDDGGPEVPCYKCNDWKDFGKPGTRCIHYCGCSESCKEYFEKRGIEHEYL